MTDRVQARSTPEVLHYDEQALECTPEPRTSAPGPSPLPPAVDQLVQNHQRSKAHPPPPAPAPAGGPRCADSVVEAGAACTAAVVWALSTSATGGLAVIGAVAAGAGCGAKLVQAYEVCEKR